MIHAGFAKDGGEESARKDYEANHIPGAHFLCVNSWLTPTFKLPTEAEMSEVLKVIGINSSFSVTFYDAFDGKFACAAAYVFQ